MSDTSEQRSVRVVREPATYDRNSGVSYFRDLVVCDQDKAAAARLERHGREMDDWLSRGAASDARELDRAGEPGGRLGGAEFRTIDRTEGFGGYYTPPKWLIEAFATAPRTPRVLAALIPCFPLPGKVAAVDVPRLTTGNQAAANADNTLAGQDIADAVTTSAVVTIGGNGVFAKQMLEQSPAGAHLDWAMFKDLREAYDQALETQLLTGGGTGTYNDTQLYGLLNSVLAANKQTYTTNTPSYCSSSTLTANLNTYIGAAVGSVGNARLQPPQAILMTTSRWVWIANGTDNQNRVIVPPDVHPPLDGDGVDGAAVSTLAGFPVYVDDAIPNTLGATGNQDAVIVCRPEDMLMLEGAQPKTTVTEEPLSGTLGIRISLWNYVAALTGRYPSGTATITGTGLVTASYTAAH